MLREMQEHVPSSEDESESDEKMGQDSMEVATSIPIYSAIAKVASSFVI